MPATTVTIGVDSAGLSTADHVEIEAFSDHQGKYKTMLTTNLLDTTDYAVVVSIRDSLLNQIINLKYAGLRKYLVDHPTLEHLDFNNDGRVGLSDLSRLVYWYKRSAPPSYLDVDKNGTINLADISIFTYYWTG